MSHKTPRVWLFNMVGDNMLFNTSSDMVNFINYANEMQGRAGVWPDVCGRGVKSLQRHPRPTSEADALTVIVEYLHE